MQCKVDGCCRPIRSSGVELCNTHYFRVYRNGTTELKGAKPRFENARGYQFVRALGHPLLAAGQSYVAEHRVVLYAAIGAGPMACELCGCPLTWKTCQVDHIDENPRNNSRENLRPTCIGCNTWRSMPPPSKWSRTHVVQHDGVALTPTEWARDPRVQVSGRTIVARKRAGMSDYEALFSEKVTHNGRAYAPKGPRKPHRKVSVRGLCMTPTEWARQPGVTVTDVTIRNRLKAGVEPAMAIFGPADPTKVHRSKQLKEQAP